MRMRLDKNDFYDIHWAIVLFRFQPLYAYNREIAARIKHVIDAPQVDGVYTNAVRRALADMVEIHQTEEWCWSGRQCTYVYNERALIDDPLAYRILSAGFAELLQALGEQNEKRIFDLADALHNIPTILADQEDCLARRIGWETGTYRKRWNRSFLGDVLSTRACAAWETRVRRIRAEAQNEYFGGLREGYGIEDGYTVRWVPLDRIVSISATELCYDDGYGNTVTVDLDECVRNFYLAQGISPEVPADRLRGIGGRWFPYLEFYTLPHHTRFFVPLRHTRLTRLLHRLGFNPYGKQSSEYYAFQKRLRELGFTSLDLT